MAAAWSTTAVAESVEGEQLLIIRGLNPLQNLINKMDAAAFYDEVTGWAKEKAAAAGRRAAIVIDWHSGGSGTNRPALYEFLSTKRDSLQRVTNLNPKDTVFNGYGITTDAYYL